MSQINSKMGQIENNIINKISNQKLKLNISQSKIQQLNDGIPPVL